MQMRSTALVVLKLALVLLLGRVLHAQKENGVWSGSWLGGCWFAVGCGFSSFECCQRNWVSTKAPLECMCRPCTGIEDANVIPQELTSFADEGTLTGYFQKSHYKSTE